MNADRDNFDPAKWSILASRSEDSVIEVFSFILLIYYHNWHRLASLARWVRYRRRPLVDFRLLWHSRIL